MHGYIIALLDPLYNLNQVNNNNNNKKKKKDRFTCQDDALPQKSNFDVRLSRDPRTARTYARPSPTPLVDPWEAALLARGVACQSLLCLL